METVSLWNIAKMTAFLRAIGRDPDTGGWLRPDPDPLACIPAPDGIRETLDNTTAVPAQTAPSRKARLLQHMNFRATRSDTDKSLFRTQGVQFDLDSGLWPFQLLVAQ